VELASRDKNSLVRFLTRKRSNEVLNLWPTDVVLPAFGLDIESLEILKVDPLTSFGTPVEIVNLFGGKHKYLSAIEQLEAELYRKAA
jgi:hypothetical protein